MKETVLNEIKVAVGELPEVRPEGTDLDIFTPILKKKAAKQLHIPEEAISSLEVIKQSVDARKKGDVKLTFGLRINGEENQYGSGIWPEFAKPDRRLNNRPVVVGAGPGGLFAALTLAEMGYAPIVIERGPKVEERVQAVSTFWLGGKLDPEANVQFGEGGAGAFSDGKLTSGIKDKNIPKVLQAFTAAGAPKEIMYMGKPHIGTDRIRLAVVNLRRRIESLGGQFYFNTKLTDILISDNSLKGIVVKREGIEDELITDRLILAIGHSARDTFYLLERKGFFMEAKSFSIGVRIEHPQTIMNAAQYGAQYKHWALKPADYKLSAHLPSGRGVYTFCMCPGGKIVAAASEEGGVCTNGMSEYARDSQWANSAVLVGITPEDFEGQGVLAGIEFQRKYEHKAFLAAGNTYKAPADTVGRLLTGKDISAPQCSYKPGIVMSPLDNYLPDFAVQSIKEALPLFNKTIRGFAGPEVLMLGVESRSSSPLRILRDDSCQSNIRGVYPCGEGAGYAGGIMSAAVDGIKCGENLIKNE